MGWNTGLKCISTVIMVFFFNYTFIKLCQNQDSGRKDAQSNVVSDVEGTMNQSMHNWSFALRKGVLAETNNGL